MNAIIITIILCVTILICFCIYVYGCKKQKERDCHHVWEKYVESEVHDDFGGINHDVTLICKKCGKIKKIKFMRIDEIMIGDWFYFQSYKVVDGNVTNTYEAMQVQHIDSYVLTPLVTSYEKIHNELKQLKPIPLTNKILDNNFTYNTESELYKCEHFSMSIYDDGVMIGQIGIGFHGEEFQYFMTIKYVHELQHLLKLFNSTKEIKL